MAEAYSSPTRLDYYEGQSRIADWLKQYICTQALSMLVVSSLMIVIHVNTTQIN